MVSYAIIHKMGGEAFLEAATASGLDGLIVPDLPVEEAEALGGSMRQRGLALIQLITPTTPADRALRIARSTTGFIYYVSVAGITGERKALPAELASSVARLREQVDLPVCIGFGVSTPEQIRDLADLADGLIVGSAIVRRFAEPKPREELVAEVARFVAELAAPLATIDRS
jgi:tryptophan synthase alpha chain